MTNWTEAADLLEERAPPGRLSRHAPGALAFALSAALGVYMVYLRPSANAPAPQPLAKSAVQPFGGLSPVAVAPSRSDLRKPAANPFGGLVVQGFGAGARFQLAEREVPLPPVPPTGLRPSEQGVPLPPRRPSDLARAVPSAPLPPTVARVEPQAPVFTSPSPAPAAGPGLFDRLFGKGASQPATSAPETRLAYAAPPPVTGVSTALAARGGIGQGAPGGFLRNLGFGALNPATRFGEHVAVYDISARVVYMPDGSRIEAHSGLGEARDDPNKVHERMRGPTPPATYALTPREELFHGVAALRLTPVEGSVYGRAGLLAHTYMLGPDGDSNGCVSFKDYDAFLRAYHSGLVTKLVVVTRL